MPSKKKAKPDCPLTIADWVNHLQNISQSSYPIMFSLIALNFSIIAILISMLIAYFIDEMIIYTGLMILVITVLIQYYSMLMTSKAKAAKRLLNEIIDGKYDSSNKIREQWLRRVREK